MLDRQQILARLIDHVEHLRWKSANPSSPTPYAEAISDYSLVMAARLDDLVHDAMCEPGGELVDPKDAPASQ